MTESHDQRDAKLRLLTYSSPHLASHCIDTASLKQNCPLDNFRDVERSELAVESTNAQYGPALGLLDHLPLELLQHVLGFSDLQSITTFRAVNTRARSFTDCDPRYCVIIRHVPNALRFMLSTGTASYIQVSDLYVALVSQRCFLCGDFGGFLNILDCRRYCFHCVNYSDELFLLTVRGVQLEFMLSRKSIAALPAALTLPGRYGLSGHHRRKRRRLILGAVAREVAIAYYGSESKMMIHISRENAKKAKRVVERTHGHPSNRANPPGPRQTNSPNFHHMGPYNPVRFQTIIRFPTLAVSTGKLEWGISCQSCRENWCHLKLSEKHKFPKLFTNEQYLQHFPQCEYSQAKWEAYLKSGGEMDEKYWPGTDERFRTLIRRK